MTASNFKQNLTEAFNVALTQLSKEQIRKNEHLQWKEGVDAVIENFSQILSVLPEKDGEKFFVEKDADGVVMISYGDKKADKEAFDFETDVRFINNLIGNNFEEVTALALSVHDTFRNVRISFQYDEEKKNERIRKYASDGSVRQLVEALKSQAERYHDVSGQQGIISDIAKWVTAVAPDRILEISPLSAPIVEDKKVEAVQQKKNFWTIKIPKLF